VELATLPSGSRSRLKKLRFFLIFLALLLLGLVSFAFGMFMAVASDLPGLENQQQYNNARNSVLLDDRGREIGVLSRQNQILVTQLQIPPIVKEAVIAIEDKRFMTNSGVDLRSIARAFVDDLLHQGAVQGASTIEQQFVKNALQEQAHRTIFEKLREAALAFHLAHKWTKEKIITEYLNTIYFGNGAYGIEAAAQTYFGHEPDHLGCGTPKQRLCVEELRPWEAALLAGIVQSPTDYNPVTHPTAARERRDVVLAQMLQQGYIPKAVYEMSVTEPLPAAQEIASPNQPLIDGIDTGYFDAWVGQQVIARYHAGPTYDGGLQIKTTLDLELQRAAEQAVNGYLPGPEGPGAALVAIENSTGKVRAMVGGRNFNETPFDLATEGERQPGSSFKAFDLAAALEDGISPDSVWTSKPKTFHVDGEVFVVHNDENAYTGENTLTNATAYSDNSIYAEVGLKVGTRRIAALAHEMGITTPISTNPAMTIGGLKIGVTPLDMAHAYETIAHGGQRVSGTLGEPGMPVGIEEVSAPSRTLPDGDHREVDHTRLRRVLPASVATTETEVLETVLEYGTAKTAALGQFAAGKTGTTSNYGDAWFVGWDSRYTVAVWVGYPNSLVPMTTDFEDGPVLGGTFPALIWHNFMVAAMGVEKRRVEEEAAQRVAVKAAREGTTTTDTGEAASAVPTSSGPAPAQVPTTPAPAPRSKARPAAPASEATEKQTAPGAKEAPSAPAGRTPPAATPEQSTPAPATPAAPPGSAPAATPEASEPKVSGGTGAPTGGAAPAG
jgi:penicillin-binding protein 1A